MLSAHYRASAVTAVDGQRVRVWNDISGNARHLTAPRGAVFRPGGLYGKPTLEFGGEADDGYVSAWAGFGGPLTVYAVVRSEGTDADIFSANSTGVTGFFIYNRLGNWSVFAGSTRNISSSTNLPTIVAVSLAASGALTGMIYDPVRGWITTTFTNIALNPATSPMFVGRPNDSGTRFFRGGIAEIIVHDDAHSAETMREKGDQLILDYFQNRSWSPVGEVVGPRARLAAAYVVKNRLDGWFKQPHLPISETPLSQWFMDEVGYTKPPPSGGGGTDPVVTTGRIFPR